MAAMSDFLENKLIDWFFRAQAIGITGATAAAGTGPATLHVALLTAAPSDTGGGTEVTGGAYARQAVTSNLTNWAGTLNNSQNVASTGTSGTTSNLNAINFPAPTANWGTITHFGIYDASTGGNLLFWGALTQSKTVNNGDAAPSFAANALSIQLDN